MSDLRPDPRAAAPIVFDAAGNVLRIDLALLPATTVLLIGGVAVPVGEVLARAEVLPGKSTDFWRLVVTAAWEVVAQRRRCATYRRRALVLLRQVRKVRAYVRGVYQYAALDRRCAWRATEQAQARAPGGGASRPAGPAHRGA